jgi:hypothetical protein
MGREVESRRSAMTMLSAAPEVKQAEEIFELRQDVCPYQKKTKPMLLSCA